MSEAAAAIEGAGGAAGAGQDGGGAGTGAAGQQQQGSGAGGIDQGQQQGDRWQDKFLPAEMRGDETLSRYASVPDLAKGLIETRAWAKGRVAVPGADDAAAFTEFAAKVRPEKAEDYKIVGADGQPSEIGEAFRGKFHEAGLHPRQAEMLTAGWNQYQADLVSKATQAGKDELTAVELDLGPAGYQQRLTATANMLKAIGIDGVDLVPALEQVTGAGKTMKALFALAEKTGELAKVDGATVLMEMGNMSADQAQAEIDAMSGNKDAAFQARLKEPGTQEYNKWKALNQTIARKRSEGQNR